MDPDSQHSQALIERFSHRPSSILRGVVITKVPEVTKPSPIQRQPGHVIMDQVHRLPLEILHSICSKLDLLSLSRFSRCSLQCQTVICSLPAYKDLVDHAMNALSALGKTRLLAYHSASTLRAALRSEDCVSCGSYGVCLFLPSCERCCYHCLQENQAFWVFPLDWARGCFGLTLQQLEQIPIMLSIIGNYSVVRTEPKKRRLRLVSVRHAKEL